MAGRSGVVGEIGGDAMRAVFFDFETAGLSEDAPNIQLAAVATEDWRVAQTWERKILFDESKADPKALELNSYDAQAWQTEAIPEKQLVVEFSRFLRDHAHVERLSKAGRTYQVARLAGHNVASFDCPRLFQMFKRHDTFLPALIYQPLDSLHRAIWYFAEKDQVPKSFKLHDLCAYFGIHQGQRHDALADVISTVALARCLTDRESC